MSADLSPEQKLFMTVVWLTVTDAKDAARLCADRSRDRRARGVRMRRELLLDVSTQWFAFVCELANLSYEAVKERISRILSAC